MNSTASISPSKLSALAGRINVEHAAATVKAQSALQHAAECGRLLIEAKGAVPHGSWGDWIGENFHGSASTARNYMRLAEGMPALKTTTVGDLGVREALALLAEPRGPKHPPAPDDGMQIPDVGVGKGPVPEEEMGDFIQAVEHPTETPHEIRERFAKWRAERPDAWTPEEWAHLEREFVANAWDGLVIGWLNVRMWQGIDADPAMRPDLREYLYDGCKGKTGGQSFWRLRSDVNAYRRYRDSGERALDEPCFPRVLESWSDLQDDTEGGAL